ALEPGDGSPGAYAARPRARPRAQRRASPPCRTGARSVLRVAAPPRLRPVSHADRRPLPVRVGRAPGRRHHRCAGTERRPRDPLGSQSTPPALNPSATAATLASMSGAPLHAMLEARSVAVIGASATPGSFGEQMMIQLVTAGGFDGAVYPVNPKYEEL